ncbi:MAG: hypothetical protein AAF195_02475, partial [Pseudomonadota bacterium]
ILTHTDYIRTDDIRANYLNTDDASDARAHAEISSYILIHYQPKSLRNKMAKLKELDLKFFTDSQSGKEKISFSLPNIGNYQLDIIHSKNATGFHGTAALLTKKEDRENSHQPQLIVGFGGLAKGSKSDIWRTLRKIISTVTSAIYRIPIVAKYYEKISRTLGFNGQAGRIEDFGNKLFEKLSKQIAEDSLKINPIVQIVGHSQAGSHVDKFSAYVGKQLASNYELRKKLFDPENIQIMGTKYDPFLGYSSAAYVDRTIGKDYVITHNDKGKKFLSLNAGKVSINIAHINWSGIGSWPLKSKIPVNYYPAEKYSGKHIIKSHAAKLLEETKSSQQNYKETVTR